MGATYLIIAPSVATFGAESSVTLPHINLRGRIMPSAYWLVDQRHSIEELVGIRRDMLRHARSFPPGADRNQRRQIALSLRTQEQGLAGRQYMGRSSDAQRSSFLPQRNRDSNTDSPQDWAGCIGCGSPMVLVKSRAGETDYDRFVPKPLAS